MQIEFVVIEESIPFEYYLFIDKHKEEVSINCENIESLSKDDKTGRLNLIYTMAKNDWLGRRTEEMVRKVDQIECAEGEDLLRVWTGVKNKLAKCLNEKFVRHDLKPKASKGEESK